MIRSFLRRHFKRHSLRSPMKFVLWTGLEQLAIGYLVLLPMAFAGFEGRNDLNQLDSLGFFLTAVIFAPIVETIIFQLIPIAIMRWIRLPFSWQVGVSTFLFFYAHCVLGPIPGLVAGLIGGFYLAFGFSHWANRSYWVAFWTTLLQHALRNGIIFLNVAIFAGFDDTESWLPGVLGVPAVLLQISIYWVFFAKNAYRFEEMLGRRVLAVAHQIRRGMPTIRAEAVFRAAGFECRKVEASDDEWQTPQLLGTISSIPYFGDSANWTVVVDLEQGFVSSVSSRMEKSSDSPTVASNDKNDQIWV